MKGEFHCKKKNYQINAHNTCTHSIPLICRPQSTYCDVNFILNEGNDLLIDITYVSAHTLMYRQAGAPRKKGANME